MRSDQPPGPESVLDDAAAAFNAHDLAACFRFYAPDIRLLSSGGVSLTGSEAAERFDRELLEAFPDAHVLTTRRVVSGATVVDERRLTGTHQGQLQTPFGSIAPTGKSIDLRLCTWETVGDGRILAATVYLDWLELLGQLEVAIPSLSAAPAAR